MKSVQIFHRHGDRTPIHSFVKDNGIYQCADDTAESMIKSRVRISIPHGSSKMWTGDCNFGQLTALGKKQSTMLGYKLSKIYKKAFKDVGVTRSSITEKDIYLRSTDVPRTIETAKLLIEGFFPNTSENIPIHVRPALVDSLHMMFDKHGNDNKLAKIYDSARTRSELYLEYKETSKKLKWELDRITGSNLEPNHYFDQFRCRECHGQSSICGTDECVSQNDKDLVYKLAEWWSSFEFDINRKEEIKLRMSDILQEIFDYADHDDYLLRFYSAHDTNLMPLLSIFSADHHYWPPYISSLIIESWIRDDQSLIRMIYNGEILNLRICDGRQYCSLSEARNSLRFILNF